MRIVELVEHVVNRKIDIERVFAQRFPVGEDIVHTETFAYNVFQVAFAVFLTCRQYRTRSFLNITAAPADFQIRILEAVGKGGRPSAADLCAKFRIRAQQLVFVRIVKARFAVADADFGSQAAGAVGRAQFVTVVFDVTGIDGFTDGDRVVAVLRIGKRVFDGLPEVAAVCGKRAVVVVEADFGIARAFGFCAVGNRDDAAFTVGLQRVIQARAAAGVVVARAEAPVFVRLPNHTETRVKVAA
ncbi:Uncharacterised protein [Neisseria meningitidis]|nr:Uncharacterised protein [Neisseria meningitidis]CWS53339.1 Uncharacterised protein [Neisseria meningitidis]CWT38558.1 Uncharacterised protein [Neisseria meningitidis]